MVCILAIESELKIHGISKRMAVCLENQGHLEITGADSHEVRRWYFSLEVPDDQNSMSSIPPSLVEICDFPCAELVVLKAPQRHCLTI